jgi:arylsulfatase A-like enzyme
MDPRAFFFQTHGYSLYEQELRTPFILSGPGITQGRVFDEPVENVDLFPTLVSLCGLKRPEDPHGVDLTTLMEGRADPEQWRSLTYSWVGQAISVRDEARGLKLVLPTPFGMERNLLAPQLFDLHADPLERVNLWPSRREDGQRLASEIIAYLERYKARPYLLTGEALERLRKRLAAMGYADAAIGLPSDGEPEAAKMKRMLLERGYLQE